MLENTVYFITVQCRIFCNQQINILKFIIHIFYIFADFTH